jgi:stearoyl-CoA desaturase (delta-9 desaturase)
MTRFTKLLSIASILSLAALLGLASWEWILASYVYYKIFVGLLGNQIAQHRYFSHKSFETSKAKKYFLYFVSLTTGINPLNYALTHRHHHVHSDTDKDLLSWTNTIFDIFSPITMQSSYKGPIKMSKVLDKDLMPFYKWHMHMIVLTLIVLTVIDWRLTVYMFLAGIGWNYVHMILFRVFLVHYKLPYSYRNFETKDQSWNNVIIQFLDFGEGLHNNHHAFPNLYNQAVNKNEFDPAGFIVKKLFVN